MNRVRSSPRGALHHRDPLGDLDNSCICCGETFLRVFAFQLTDRWVSIQRRCNASISMEFT